MGKVLEFKIKTAKPKINLNEELTYDVSGVLLLITQAINGTETHPKNLELAEMLVSRLACHLKENKSNADKVFLTLTPETSHELYLRYPHLL